MAYLSIAQMAERLGVFPGGFRFCAMMGVFLRQFELDMLGKFQMMPKSPQMPELSLGNESKLRMTRKEVLSMSDIKVISKN